MADITTARPKLAGRERVRADSGTGTGYRTFPSRLPAVLSALGGALIVLGALGASVRASTVTRLREDPTTMRLLMGHDSRGGWALAIIGAAIALGSIVWLKGSALHKIGAAILVVATGALVGARLIDFNDLAAVWAEEARRTPEFIGYHAGLGWGAWSLLAGTILAGFGVLIGGLRALDVRKGIGV